ncbi:Zinc carboxypeptidase [Tenacibaculum sp. 190130A14a]|uniref:Zinc carboxypeptidase n=1 Tax=Tenacibaculum polynesiense TaxID=3137857 RepID=A0ABM9PC06_9FLAO
MKLSLKFLEENYLSIKESSLFGRWIPADKVHPLIEKFKDSFDIEEIGSSEQERSIYKLNLGKGTKRILVWSQMHGNESTGTKAVFDLLNFIIRFKDSATVKSIIEECTIQVIPLLNPDGAEFYTRVNANNIDLNRDAVDLKAKESKILRKVLDDFNPHFCFNLHDQRTIFGVEGTANPATISFLAPSEEETRKLTPGRIQTMNVIVAMNNLLQEIIPNYIGRYTDEFYPTATGDNFQKLGHNTILIEAGHYKEDYDREEVRKFNFYALLQGIFHISIENKFENYEEYFSIPNNIKNFYDVIHRNENKEKEIAFMYEEKVENGTFALNLKEVKKGNLSNFHGHKEFNKFD